MNTIPVMRIIKRSLAVAYTMAIVLSSSACTQDKLTPDVARDLATEAWLFGLPLVMFEKQVDYSTHVTQAEKTAPENGMKYFNTVDKERGRRD